MMKTENVMWLLVVVFMVHDFEEIIMIQPWLARNAANLNRRFPKMAGKLISQYQKLSTSSFALAVAVEFILLSFLTYLTVERELYSLWAGILLGYFIHLLAHIGQFIVYRRYVPAIFTSLLTAIYCIWAIIYLNALHPLAWNAVFLWTLITVLVLVVGLLFIHWLARRFEQYLRVFSMTEEGSKSNIEG
jgi:hypothetical protein